MSTLNQELNAIKAVEDTLTANKVANFAYTQEAYDNNDADGVEEYDFDNEQNIPVGSLSVLKVNETVLTKGWRSQASAITRMLMNHFLGRLSYNLNKINDNVSALLSTLISKAGNADGFATLGSNGKVPDAQLGRALADGVASLDSNGRIPYSQLPESAIEYKGQWDADTNTPTLADGTGTKGDFYIVSVAGTQNLGSGDIQFFVNDRVIYDDSVWSRLSAGDVKSVNNITPVNGNITLTKADVGLGNVDNTSDSDLPALNGTNKFTTAGAYNMLISIAPAFDKTVTYNVGNYVTYQGKLYKCTNAHTGAWRSANFTLISVGEDLEKVAPLDYLLDTEQDQFKKWVDGKEVYRKVKQISPNVFTRNTSFPQDQNIRTLCVYQGKLYVGIANHGLFVSEDGITFTQSTLSDFTPAVLYVYQGKLYVGTSGKGFYVTEDGITFTQSTNLPYAFTTEAICEYNGKLYVGTAKYGLFVSENGLYFTRNESFPENYTVKALCVYQGKLYVGTETSGMYSSIDGDTFIYSYGYPAEIPLIAFYVYKGKLYVGTGSHGIYVSSDGETFTQNTSFPTDYIARKFCECNGKLYVGTANHGLFVSEDGITFTQNTFFTTNYTVQDICEYNNTLYVGAQGAGLWIALVTISSSFPNLTVDQSVDNLIDIKLVVDGSNINPTFTQRAGNQVKLAIPSDAQSALFPAFNVYAILEYTKP